MGFDLTHNCPQFALLMSKKGNLVSVVVRKGLTDATKILHVESLKQLSNQVYDQPETDALRRSRKTGRVRKVLLWKRSKNLYRAEAKAADYSKLKEFRTELVDPSAVDNRVVYAVRRHFLKYPAKTKYRTLSGRDKKATVIHKERPNRTANWRADTVKNVGGAARDAIEKAVEIGFSNS